MFLMRLFFQQKLDKQHILRQIYVVVILIADQHSYLY